MTSNLRKNHIMFRSSGYYQIRNKRFASARFPEHANKGKSAVVLLVALVLFGAVLETVSGSRMMRALQSAFNSPSLRAYANEQGDGSDSLIFPPESRSSQAGSSPSSANP
jgi:hypothetical protein